MKKKLLAIEGLRRCSYTVAEVAALVDVSDSTAKRWCAQWRAKGWLEPDHVVAYFGRGRAPTRWRWRALP